jgi:hypothetical protein
VDLQLKKLRKFRTFIEFYIKKIASAQALESSSRNEATPERDENSIY